jgi:hypothetical protein
MNKLTGKKRLRIHRRWFRRPLLVLQLQVEGSVPYGDGCYVAHQAETWWVDATLAALKKANE